MNWKGYGRKLEWPNLTFKPSICLERLTNTTKYLSQGSWCPYKELNRTPTDVKSDLPTNTDGQDKQSYSHPIAIYLAPCVCLMMNISSADDRGRPDSEWLRTRHGMSRKLENFQSSHETLCSVKSVTQLVISLSTLTDYYFTSILSRPMF